MRMEHSPAHWPGSFQMAMQRNLIEKIDPKLRPPQDRDLFLTKDILADYGKMIDMGGRCLLRRWLVWSHCFWEADIGLNLAMTLKVIKAGPRLWSSPHDHCAECTPLSVVTHLRYHLRPIQLTCPDSRCSPSKLVRWIPRRYVSWQRFIARLVAHGPVNTSFQVLFSRQHVQIILC